MSQSSLLFFYLGAGFLIYIVAKGELPAYLATVFGPVKSSS